MSNSSVPKHLVNAGSAQTGSDADGWVPIGQLVPPRDLPPLDPAALPWMVAHAQACFDGKPLDGPSLMTTLRTLSHEDALSNATYEGYSPWEITIHLTHYKHEVVEMLLKGPVRDQELSSSFNRLQPFPYEGLGFPSPRNEDRSPEGWSLLLERLERTHALLMAAIGKLEGRFFNTHAGTWDVSWGQTLAWILTHDLFHNVQLRNMGIPSLRQGKRV